MLRALDKHAGLLTILWTLAGYLFCETTQGGRLTWDYRLIPSLTLLWLGIWLMLAIAAVQRGTKLSRSCVSVTATTFIVWILYITSPLSSYAYSGPGNWYPEIPAGAPIVSIGCSSPEQAESIRFHRRAEGFIHLLGLKPTKRKFTNSYPSWFLSDYRDDNVAAWSYTLRSYPQKGQNSFGAVVVIAPLNKNYAAADFDRLTAKLEEIVKYISTTEVHVTRKIATGIPRRPPVNAE